MPPSPFPPIVNGTLSVIVPIYNEAATVCQSLDAILAKTVPGWTLQIIMVESNSTDGTRSIVETYAAHPRVKLILEDRPRGKGHAVRAGLALVTIPALQTLDIGYDKACATAGVWFQLLWIPALWVFLRWLGLTEHQAHAATSALVFTGFLLFNTIFVWPKLAGAASSPSARSSPRNRPSIPAIVGSPAVPSPPAATSPTAA